MQGRLSTPVEGKIQAFPWSTWQNEFYLLRESGLKVLEWTLDYDNLFHNPLFTSDGLMEIRELSSKFDISITSVTCDNFMQAPIFARAKQARTTIDDIHRFFQLAPEEIRYWIWPLVDQGAPRNSSEWDEMIEFLFDISPHLERSGSRILFETELDAQANKDFLKRLPPSCFGLNLDIGNTVANGFDPQEEFKLNYSRIYNIHIKDRLCGGPTVPLGHGAVVWRNLRDPLNDFKGNLILQCARTAISEMEQLRIYINFMQSLLSEGKS